MSEQRRVEELLRVNAALAAEIRSLSAGRTDAPRARAMPTARRIGALLEERDALARERDAFAASLEVTSAHRDEIERANTQLAAEVARLRTGLGGVLRRLRARLLQRPRG